MWDTKSSTLAIDKSAAGRIDRPQRRSGKCNRGRSSGISPRKVYGWNFGQRVKGGGKPGADGKNRLSRGTRKRRVRIGKGLTNTGEYIRVHVGIFAIKLTRKQRLCQRHRAPLDRYIFISISRMFLKPYRRGTSHMGHIFHNDVLAYTLENARPTWYRVNWNAPVCFARANRSPMRELYSEKKNIRYTRHTCDATEKEQELIIDYGVEKSQISAIHMSILKDYLYNKCFYVCG